VDSATPSPAPAFASAFDSTDAFEDLLGPDTAIPELDAYAQDGAEEEASYRRDNAAATDREIVEALRSLGHSSPFDETMAQGTLAHVVPVIVDDTPVALWYDVDCDLPMCSTSCTAICFPCDENAYGGTLAVDPEPCAFPRHKLHDRVNSEHSDAPSRSSTCSPSVVKRVRSALRNAGMT